MQKKMKQLIAAVILGAAFAVGAVTIGQAVQQPTTLVANNDPGHGGSGGGGG